MVQRTESKLFLLVTLHLFSRVSSEILVLNQIISPSHDFADDHHSNTTFTEYCIYKREKKIKTGVAFN